MRAPIPQVWGLSRKTSSIPPDKRLPCQSETKTTNRANQIYGFRGFNGLKAVVENFRIAMLGAGRCILLSLTDSLNFFTAS
jgi:hypothetical protein